MDKLSELFQHFSVTAGVFHTGKLCGLAHFNDNKQAIGHIHLLRNGHVTVTDEHNQTDHISQPSLIFYPKPTPHRFLASDIEPADLVCATVHYGSGINNPIAHALPDKLIIPLEDIPSLSSFLNHLFIEADEAKDGRTIIMDRLIELILIHLLRHLIEQHQVQSGLLAALSHPRLANVMLYIHNHPQEPLTLQSLADQAAMSRSLFSETFKSIVGNSAGDYVLEWKIQVAQDFLKKGKPINFVANEVGYGDQSAFTKAFKKKVGLSPRAWLGQQIHH